MELVRQQVHAHADAFYVVDLAEVAHKLNEWYSQLPRVRPYYAVKCNDDPQIVKTLASLGAGFDCATKGEMSMALGLGVKPEDIIFAHPAKQPSHIRYAHSKGVAKMTFDNEEELRKIAREHPGAQAVLRILTDDSHSVCRLGLKFGAPVSQVRHLLTVAKEVGVSIIGVSYHVGSGNGNAASFADAVKEARAAFDVAKDMGTPFKLLDIGGGFPGSELGSDIVTGLAAPSTRLSDDSNPYSKHPSFKVIASHVRAALDKYFPEGCGVDIIAEPGRFFVKSTHTLAVNVVGKRVTSDEASSQPRFNYYVNDGLYGSFNCILYDHVTMAPDRVLPKQGTGRPELDLAALAAARAALASTADDSVSRLGSDGTPVVQDAVGLGTAMQLGQIVDEQQQVVRRRMVMGGEDAAETSTVAMSAGGPTAGPSARSFGSTSTAAHARGVSTRADLGTVSASLPAVHPTTLWGPTCDSMDKISDSTPLPELAVGDWLVFENAGAYTIAGSCKFNGFPLSTKVYRHLDGTLEIQREEEHA